MKLIKNKAELLSWIPGIEGVYKMIELAGRTCYKSIDKITDNSAKPFVDKMINSKHLAMLEHGTVYLYLEVNPNNCSNKFEYPLTHFTYNYNWSDVVVNITSRYKANKYSKVRTITTTDHEHIHKVYITTNFRVIVENGWQDDLQFICSPTDYHEKRYSFKLTTSIGVTRELNRHRVNSIAEQSTRYCNYSKDKFGKEITFCIPSWTPIQEGHCRFYDIEYLDEYRPLKPLLLSMYHSERNYMELIEKGWSPQQAREVLPLCTATEIIHTAFASDWKHFFDLRLLGKTGTPHPNMLDLSKKMAEEAEKAGILNDVLYA